MQVACVLDENASTPGINQSSVLGPIHAKNVSSGVNSLNIGPESNK